MSRLTPEDLARELIDQAWEVEDDVGPVLAKPSQGQSSRGLGGKTTKESAENHQMRHFPAA